MSNTRQQLESWLKTIDVKGSVLDVGGIAKPIIPSRVKGWDVIDYKILDHRPETRNRKADYVYDLNNPIDGLFQNFDIVFCLEVMEYIWDSVQALININKFLKPGGTLYISFHFLFPHHDPEKIDYLRYTRQGIKKLMKETGFEIEEMIPRMAKSPERLITWCQEESKVVKNSGEIGYLVKAKK